VWPTLPAEAAKLPGCRYAEDIAVSKHVFVVWIHGEAAACYAREREAVKRWRLAMQHEPM